MLDNFKNFETIWKDEPIVVLDTNIFLRLYSFSSEATKEVLDILKTTKESIWLPHQVVKEFHDSHAKEHKKNFNKYTEFVKSILRTTEHAKNTLEKDLLKHQENRFPMLDDLKEEINEKMTQIQASIKKYEKTIKNDISENEKMLLKDEIKDFIIDLENNDSTGEPLTISELVLLYQEGEIRYKHLIPPGYKDIDKDKDDPTKQKKFGDLILWKQVLQHAVKKNKALLFVTNDLKEDWWENNEKNEPTQARNELIKEFMETVGNKFLMTSGANYINYVSSMEKVAVKRFALELMAEYICKDIFSTQDWSLILNGNGDLEAYLLFSDELEPYFDGLISNVEITDYSSADELYLIVEKTEYFHEKAFITGYFKCSIDISIMSTTISGESFEASRGYCDIDGTFSVEFKLDHENAMDSYKNNSVNILVGGFGVEKYSEFVDPRKENCIHCSGKSEKVIVFNEYGHGVCEKHINMYDYCPDCNQLFNKGSLINSRCITCESD